METAETGSSFQRHEIPYVNKCSRFLFDGQDQNYELQFNELYNARLSVLRPRIREAAEKKWGSNVSIRALAELYENKDECVIIGTIYKVQELKPSILKQVAADASIKPQPIRSMKFVGENDQLILEDEDLRVNLVHHIDHGALVTGVTVGVYGSCEESGRFKVVDICFPQRPRLPRPMSIPSNAQTEDLYVLLISGLNFNGTEDGDQDDARRVLLCRLFADWITGQVGSEKELSKISRIAKVIIAGGNISKKCHCDGREYAQGARFKARKATVPSVEAVRQFDNYLCEIAASVDIDLMPGERDPTNFMLPQQPWHKCLLPKSSQFGNLHQCTNPYAAEIGGLSFLGTSGQNVDDILKYSSICDSLDVMESTLKWCQLCPTAPDTLDCYPYRGVDPFLITDDLPHVYFVGNQPDLRKKLIEHEMSEEDDEEEEDGPRKTLLLTVPVFSESGVCALVNLRTLDVEPIVFALDDFFQDQSHANGDIAMEVNGNKVH